MIMVDGYGTYPLNHCLLEESWRNNAFAANETIWIDQCAADNTRKDDAEATSEHLRKIPNNSTTGHRSQVCDNLCDSDSVGGEAVLVGQHRWVQILASM